MDLFNERERDREREREHSRDRERERERERQRERDRDLDRDRDREYRREAKESSGAVNDSTSMRPKDVCLFPSIYYLAKLCTTISPMVNLWAAAAAVERSAALDNAFTTVDSDIYRTRKALCCIPLHARVRSSECQLDWAVFLANPGKADVLRFSGSHKQQSLVRVVWQRRPVVVPLPVPRVQSPSHCLSCVRCSLGYRMASINWEKHICLLYLRQFYIFLGWDS